MHSRKLALIQKKAPATWDELVEDAQKLTNENRYGVGIALNPVPHSGPLQASAYRTAKTVKT